MRAVGAEKLLARNPAIAWCAQAHCSCSADPMATAIVGAVGARHEHVARAAAPSLIACAPAGTAVWRNASTVTMTVPASAGLCQDAQPTIDAGPARCTLAASALAHAMAVAI